MTQSSGGGSFGFEPPQVAGSISGRQMRESHGSHGDPERRQADGVHAEKVLEREFGALGLDGGQTEAMSQGGSGERGDRMALAAADDDDLEMDRATAQNGHVDARVQLPGSKAKREGKGRKKYQ